MTWAQIDVAALPKCYDTLTSTNLCTIPESAFDDGTINELQNSYQSLRFTFLPIVRLTGDFGYEYAEGSVEVIMPGVASDEVMHAKIKWRGGTTNTDDKHKRNYHLKFINNVTGAKQDRRFFGLRNDNSWLLDAAQVDFSRIRNRAATDLWNDFATKPYYFDNEKKALTGTRGQFVELFLNDEYRGIYCMTEAMDRSQLKLKKYDEATSTIHGQLWKSGGYINSFAWSYNNIFDNTSDVWGSIELKYPDIEDVNPTDWTTYYDAVSFVRDLPLIDLRDLEENGLTKEQYDEKIADFSDHAPEYFDIPVIADYLLFCNLLNAIDNNNGKNVYWACYDKQTDKKLTLAVWDLDCTVGGYYDPTFKHSPSMVSPEAPCGGKSKLLYALDRFNIGGLHTKMMERYHELRSSIFSEVQLISRYTDYMDMLNKSGAYYRDAERWSGDSDLGGNVLNYDEERQYIVKWLTDRLAFLDKNLHYTVGQFYDTDISLLEEISNKEAGTPRIIISRNGCTSYDSEDKRYDKRSITLNSNGTDFSTELSTIVSNSVGMQFTPTPFYCNRFIDDYYQGLFVAYDSDAESNTTLCIDMAEDNSEVFGDNVMEKINAVNFAKVLLANDVLAMNTTKVCINSNTDQKISARALCSLESSMNNGTDEFSALHNTSFYSRLLSDPMFLSKYISLWDSTKTQIASDLEAWLNSLMTSLEKPSLEVARHLNNMYFDLPDLSVDEEVSTIREFMSVHLAWLDDAIANMSSESGIDNISASICTPQTYNTLGQRVSPNAKGLLIINGKKHIVH